MFLISRNINQIYLAGFDGFTKDGPNQDSTFAILESFKKMKKVKKVQLMTWTSTRLNLKKVNINQII